LRVLVTGGAGFIGSHLVEDLLAQGQKVVVLDDLSTGDWANLASVANHRNLTLLTWDVRDAQFLENLLRNVALVYHLAGWGPKQAREDVSGAVSVNVMGTASVMQAAMVNSCRVVYASCSEVYGRPSQQPLREDADSQLGSPSEPVWAFAAMKLMAELACLSCAERGLPVTILRLFDVYGPRDRSGLTSALLAWKSDGVGVESLPRSLLYVSDAVDALVLAGHCELAAGEIVNVGWNRPIPGMERAAGGVGVPDTRKAERLLGFAPRVDLEEGLALTRIKGRWDALK